MTRLAPLLALALLAGCVGPATPPASDAAAPPPATTAADASVVFEACTFVEGFYGVPMDDARAALPEGFEPAPALDGVSADMLVTAFACDAASVNGSAPAPATVLWAGLVATPPEEWRAGGVQSTIVLLGSDHTSAEAAAVFAAWHQGDVGVAEPAVETTRSGDALVGEARTDGLVVRSQVAVAMSRWDRVFARFFAVDDREVVGAMQLEALDHDFVAGSSVLEGTPVFGFPTEPRLAGMGVGGGLGRLTFTWVPRDALAEPPGA